MAASATLAARAPTRPRAHAAALTSPSAALFLGLFASSAGVLVLSPILVDVARDSGVSTAVAGQLRLAAAPLAAFVAVGVVRWAGRFALRSLLAAGAALVGVDRLRARPRP